MDHRGYRARNPHLQMGARVVATLIVAALAFTTPIAGAATKKPTAKPVTKVSAKASSKSKAKVTAKPKATVKTKAKTSSKPSSKSSTTKVKSKASAQPTSKASAKSTSTSTAKASTKPAPPKKKIIVKKKKKRKKVRITPSPKPSWPPKGFAVEGEVYAKVPTAKELVGLISANASLGKKIKECTTYICGSVQVASETGCIWWEVISTVTDGQGAKLGELNSAFTSSGAREFKTLIVVSPESAEKGGAAKIGSVICHHEDRVTTEPSINYKKAQ